MELVGPWGKKDRPNKAERKRRPQRVHFQSPDYEDWIISVISKDPDRSHAERHAEVLHLRESKRRHKAGQMKRVPSSIALHQATEEEENEYIEWGSRSLPENHPLKHMSRYFRPSPHIQQALDQIWPRL